MAVSNSFLTKSVFSKMFRNATSAMSSTDRPDPNDPDVTIRAVDTSVNYRTYADISAAYDSFEMERLREQYLNANPGELIPLEPRDRINFDTVRERMRASRDYMMSVNSYPPSIMTSGTINVDDIELTLDVGNAMSLCCNARAMTEIHDEMAICSECKEWSIFINEEEEFTDETFEY